MTRRNRPEEILHRHVVQFLRVALPPGKALFNHPAGGGYRTKAEAGIFKALGVQAGEPDLYVIWLGDELAACDMDEPGARILFIELKALNGRLSENQRLRILQYTAIGVPVHVCRTVEQVEDVLRSWNVPLTATLQPLRYKVAGNGKKNATVNRSGK